MTEVAARNKARELGQHKRFAQQYAAALRKVLTLARNAPAGLRIPKWLVVSLDGTPVSNELFDETQFQRLVEARIAICKTWDKKLPKHKPDAHERRLAAKAASSLCRRHGVTLTTTRSGTFCQLAAALYGDLTADLQYHCREIARGKKQQPL
jgi:hypothetical protein